MIYIYIYVCMYINHLLWGTPMTYGNLHMHPMIFVGVLQLYSCRWFVQPPARQGENPYGSSRLIVCAMLVLYNYMVYNPQQENTVILGWYRFDISLTQFNITLISDIISRFPTFSDCSFCRWMLHAIQVSLRSFNWMKRSGSSLAEHWKAPGPNFNTSRIKLRNFIYIYIYIYIYYI